MTTKLGHEAKTVPQIFWYGKYIGGYNELALEIENTRNYGDGNLG
jgi:glutaredoxin